MTLPHYHPLRLLLVVVVSIFSVEYGIMVVLQWLVAPPAFLVNFIDATVLVLITYPVLYFFAFRPLVQEINIAQELKRTLQISNTDLLKFKLAVDNASDHVIITDPDAIVLYVNRACASITGYLPEEVIGKKAGKLWGNMMGRPFYQHMWQTIKSDKKTFIGEMTNRRKNGSIYQVVVSISPVLDGAGKILFFVALERDNTKQKETDKAKSEFVSLATHQMRTPITVINWCSEMILDGHAGTLNEKQTEYFNDIYAASKRMNEIIKSFLHILRLETAEHPAMLVQTNVASIAEETLKGFRLESEKKAQHIVEHFDSSLPSIMTDPDLIKVILQNFISNAIKYTAEHGEIVVTLAHMNKGSTIGEVTVKEDSLLMAVQDSGIGIPPSENDQIFTKFFRAANAKRDDPNGNGLGLYMSKIMVDLLGGMVWFTSIEGKGTTFFVLLPIQKEPISN